MRDLEVGDKVYVNGFRHQRRPERDEHYYGSTPEIRKWEKEKTPLVVVRIGFPKRSCVKAVPSSAISNDFAFSFHPLELSRL